MAASIGFGRGATPRPGIRDASRYVSPKSLHVGAVWLAAAAPLFGILVMIGIR